MVREYRSPMVRRLLIACGLTAALVSALVSGSCGFFTHLRPGGSSMGDNGGGGSGVGGGGDNADAGPPDEIVDGGPPPDVLKTSCVDTPYADPWSPGYTPDPAVVSAVQATLGGLSLSEKADQMRGTSPGGNQNFSDIFRTPDNANKGIRGFLFRDGPRGVNLAAQLPTGKNGWS